MLKNRLTAIMLMLILCAGMQAGCGSEGSGPAQQDDGSETVSEESQADSGDDQTDWNDIEEQEEIDISSLSKTPGIDVDLTILSSTMVYSVVNDMLTRPNEYIGKKIKMAGLMSVYNDEESGNTYYACIIQDATACCAQGIEFLTTDEYPPESYPADGEEITVTGTYDLYEEDGYQYCVLKSSSLE